MREEKKNEKNEKKQQQKKHTQKKQQQQQQQQKRSFWTLIYLGKDCYTDINQRNTMLRWADHVQVSLPGGSLTKK